MNIEAYQEKLSSIFSIQYKDETCPPNTLPHIHDAYELLLVLSPQVCCSINNKDYIVQQNSILIFNNTDLHQIKLMGSERYIRYVIYFEPEFIAHMSTMQTQLLECFYNRAFDSPRILPLTTEELMQIRSLIEQIQAVQEGKKDAYGYDLLLHTRLAELLVSVNRLYRSYHGITDHQLPPDYRQFYRLLDYVHQHLDERITLETLAAQFYLSKRFVSQIFHKVVGMSLGEYVVRCRIMRATILLSNGLRVEEVCEQTGFQNLSHFSRTFKKYIGISPKQYSVSHISNN